ncbi:hypothetical protein Tco_0857261 [Tanacetum coccineum]|uniref:Uncharacterized protein n=1 Tax=Tanacetum coccineum TaxID=301880 RepID=A0ABQ5B7L2_9ASTR
MSSEGSDSTICSDIVFRDWVNSYSCDEIVLDIFYNGCFIIYPFNYGGDALELKISKVNKLSYKQMCDLLVEKVNEDIWHWFYCKPDCCLEEGLTIVENDRDVKIMYEMANLHGHLEVYVAHFPQYLVTDYYLKNLCVDETDDEVTKQLLSHQKIYKEAKCFPSDLKGKSLLDDFDEEEGEGLGSLSSKRLSGDLKGKSLLDDFEKVEGEGEGEGLGSSSSKFRLIIMANLPPNNNEFAPAAKAAPDIMNGWILPYQGADLLYPPPPASDSEAEAEDKVEAEDEAEAEAEAEVTPIPPPVPANPIPKAATIGTGRLTPLKRRFTDTQVWTGSSSSAAAACHNPEDLTPSHIRSNLDALHCRVQHIEEEDVRADNKCWFIMVENLLPPRLQYQEPPYALPEALLAPVTHNDPRDPYVAARDAATAPATDNDDSPTQKETSPAEPQGPPPSDS